MEQYLHHRDEEAKQQPDVDVLKTRRPGQFVAQTGQHGGHHEHGLVGNRSVVKLSIDRGITVKLMVMM